MNPATRRRFRQDSTALATGAVMAQAEPVYGEGSLEPIRIAVIGTGTRGCDLIRALTTIAAAKVVAVCDPYGPHLERGWQYVGPLARTLGDHRKLLEDTKPQAVVVAVPLASHFDICRDAIDAGCAVFCEKTMCYTAHG